MAASWREGRSWAQRAQQPPVEAALAPPRDAQHATPELNLFPVDWRSTELVPTLPLDMMGDQLLQVPVGATVADREPDSHSYGVGVTVGTDRQNRDLMVPWHEQDLGSVAARRYQPQASRDGSYHVQVIPDMLGDGDSPQTVTLRHVTGVGAANDPHARRAQRIWRWRDRYIDRHFWGVARRPVYIRNAYTAPDSPPPPAGGAYASPYPTGGWSGQDGIGTPDQLVMPTERRTPRPWDEIYTVDPSTAAAGYGLSSWGL